MSTPLACVIPALNAAPSLPGVIAGVRHALPDATLIGVDDGSSDETGAIVQRLCDVAIAFPQNRGKGAALRAAFEVVLAGPYQAVLTLDADGQHDPTRAPALVAAAADADIVIGSRERRESAMPIHRRVSNALSTRAICRVARCEIPDTQSGYRVLRRVVLERVQAQGDRYEYETDLLIRAGRAGFRFAAVPIPTIYGAPSHFREIRDAARVIRTIWQYHVGAQP